MRLPGTVAIRVALLLVSSWGAEGKDVDQAGDKTAEAPALPAPAWHGTVGCAKCTFEDTSLTECAAAVKTADRVYLLKPGPTAPPAVKEYLVRIQNQEMIGAYLIKGEKTELDGKTYVAVSTMVAKPLPKSTSTLSLNRTNRSQGSDTADGDKGGGGEEGDGVGRRGRGRRGPSNEGGGAE